QNLIPLIQAADDIDEQLLVGALEVVGARKVGGPAEHTQALEVNAFHEIRPFDVEPRDDARVLSPVRVAHASPRARFSSDWCPTSIQSVSIRNAPTASCRSRHSSMSAGSGYSPP